MWFEHLTYVTPEIYPLIGHPTSIKHEETNVKFGNLLIDLYDEPHRVYHNLNHIGRLFEDYKNHINSVKHVNGTVKLAIWFHDAIYDPTKNNNEEKSARLYRAYMDAIGIDTYASDEVEKIILRTKHEDVAPENQNEAFMRDLDLAHFAYTDYNSFKKLNNEVRKEYSVYTDKEYTLGRIKFVTGMLMRKKIYHIIPGLESIARYNLEQHLKELIESL